MALSDDVGAACVSDRSIVLHPQPHRYASLITGSRLEVANVSVMDDWDEERHDGIVDRLDPTGERSEQLDPQWNGDDIDGSVRGDWAAQRHDYNLEHDLEDDDS